MSLTVFVHINSIYNQFESTVCTGIIGQGGQCKLGSAGGVEYTAIKVGTNTIQQHLTSLADATTDDYHFRVNHIAQVGQELSKISKILIQNVHGHNRR